MNWDRFNDQFRETFGETQDRWRTTRAKRKAEGKCWQCAKLIAECTCPNVSHSPAVVGTPPTGVAGMSGRTAPVVKSFSGSARDERCLEVWFADKVTNDTRAWLLEAINEKAMSANWRERALHAETVLAEQDIQKAGRCPGCDGHECDNGCQYPGVSSTLSPSNCEGK